MKKVLAHFSDYKFFLVLSVVIFAVLRFPSLFEPYWYGDEGIYEVVGMALNRGRILYEGIWDNKPPLLYIIYSLFDGDLFYVRLSSLIVGIVTVAALFLFARKLFARKTSIYVSTIIFSIFFSIPLFEGNIANAENFMLLPLIIAFYIAVLKPFKNANFNLVLSGLLLSFTFLIKTVAVFDLAALVVFIVVADSIGKKNVHVKNIVSSAKGVITILISFVTPILITTLYFLSKGSLEPFLKAVFIQNVSYVGYENEFFIPMGLLLFKVGLLVAGILLTTRFRNFLGKEGTLISLWLMFSLFSTFFSQRPYDHYLLLLLPSFSLLTGLALNKRLIYIGIPAIISILILANVIFSPKPLNTFKYYQNYLSFIVGAKSTNDYLSYFDKRTPLDYEIANFIKSKTEDDENVFLWSDSAQIYALSNKLPPGRYIVSYHITLYPNAIEATKNAVDEKRPKYIIQTANTPEIINFLDDYQLRYKIEDVKIYERES